MLCSQLSRMRCPFVASYQLVLTPFFRRFATETSLVPVPIHREWIAPEIRLRFLLLLIKPLTHSLMGRLAGYLALGHSACGSNVQASCFFELRVVRHSGRMKHDRTSRAKTIKIIARLHETHIKKRDSTNLQAGDGRPSKKKCRIGPDSAARFLRR